MHEFVGRGLLIFFQFGPPPIFNQLYDPAFFEVVMYLKMIDYQINTVLNTLLV